MYPPIYPPLFCCKWNIPSVPSSPLGNKPWFLLWPEHRTWLSPQAAQKQHIQTKLTFPLSTPHSNPIPSLSLYFVSSGTINSDVPHQKCWSLWVWETDILDYETDFSHLLIIWTWASYRNLSEPHFSQLPYIIGVIPISSGGFAIRGFS